MRCMNGRSPEVLLRTHEPASGGRCGCGTAIENHADLGGLGIALRGLGLDDAKSYDSWEEAVATCDDNSRGGLAAEGAAMSRSAFAARFDELVGTSESGATRWRMHLAVIDPRDGSRSIEDVAAALGSRSGPGFRRAVRWFYGK